MLPAQQQYLSNLVGYYALFCLNALLQQRDSLLKQKNRARQTPDTVGYQLIA